MEITNSPVPAVASKINFFLTMTQLAEITTVKITVWHICGTDYVYYNEISLHWRQ